MSIRLPTAWWVPAALFAAGLCLPAAAKPPDLPVQEKFVCEPTATPAPGPAAPEEDDLHARAAEETARRTARRCLLFAANPFLGLLPADEWLDGDGDGGTPDLSPAGGTASPDGFRIGVDLGGRIAPSPDDDNPDSTCPYLRDKAACDRAAAPPAPEAPGTVVENLEKLDHAARVYHRAEAYRRRGKLEEARGCYESIRELCPGSRFARLAGERLEQLQAGEAEPAGDVGGEEEDAVPPPPKERKGEKHSALQSTERRVAALLERCQRAFAEERYDEAERLARRAVALDPGAVAAHPLVYKLQLLAQLHERIENMPRRPLVIFADQSGGPGYYYDPSRVIELMHSYYEFFKKGLYTEAELYALQALAVAPNDPTVFAAARLAAMQRLAHPLVYKLQLLTQLREKIEKMPQPPAFLIWEGSGGPRPTNDASRVVEVMHCYYDFFKQGLYAEAEFCALQALALDPNNPVVFAAARLAALQQLSHTPVSEPAVCPWATEAHTTMRQPDLPPVDPMTVGAMDKILIEIGEPQTEKVTVTVEEQGAAEEEAEPPSVEDPPILPIDAPCDDPVKQAGQTLPLQDLLDVLRSSACVEVETTPLCGRGQCQVPLGLLSAHAEWDCRGEHGSFLLSLVYGDATDLRAEEWEYNDRVADWITRHSGDAEQADDGWQP